MIKPLTVRLRETNAFFDLFENGDVPVTSMGPGTAELEGVGHASVYLMDSARMTPEQVEAVARRVAERFKAPLDEVRLELTEHGLPIRATEIAAGPAIDLRFIL